MFHCFGLRYNRHQKWWNKHQKCSCNQNGMQPKKWTKQPIWCLIARRFTLFGHNSSFAQPKWSVQNNIVHVGKEWLLTCPRNKKRVFVKTHAESFHGQGWCQTTSIDKNTVQWQWHGFFCSPLMFCSKTTKNTCSVMWLTALDEVTFHQG